MFFVDGPGGTGKTFLYNTLLTYVRSQPAKIAIAVASSGIAALLLNGGQTAHSRFGIPISLHARSICTIPVQSQEAVVIRQSELIIWDEAPMCHCHAIEAVDRRLRDIMGVQDRRLEQIPFGGKTILFGGDFRQTLPVIQHGSRGQIVDAYLKSSPL